MFDYIKQSYLLTSRMLTEMAHNAKLSPQEQQKLEFYTRQYVDALSPTNFAFTTRRCCSRRWRRRAKA